MKFEFDEFNFKDEIDMINMKRQMEQKQAQNKQTLGFNVDELYNVIDKDIKL